MRLRNLALGKEITKYHWILSERSFLEDLHCRLSSMSTNALTHVWCSWSVHRLFRVSNSQISQKAAQLMTFCVYRYFMSLPIPKSSKFCRMYSFSVDVLGSYFVKQYLVSFRFWCVYFLDPTLIIRCPHGQKLGIIWLNYCSSIATGAPVEETEYWYSSTFLWN